ncbi:MAG TPA: energy transducer TonB [Acidobacteriaceae bacterium]|nr:energy transducer TonB [Acidobacteriaceae bacterium]
MAKGGLSLPSLAQEPASAAPPAATVEMPHNPDALMLLAAEMNGLSGVDVKPWHLKASYTVTDEHGATKEQGILEELWAGPRKNRTTYTVGQDFETTYVTDNGAFRTGSLTKPNGLALEADREFVYPLPARAYLEHAEFEMHSQKVGSGKLNCVEEKPPSGFQRNGPASAFFCFNLDKPVLRIDASAFGNKQAVRNAIVLFQGKYVPKDIHITVQDKTSLTAHIEGLESLASVQDADFSPPSDAMPLPHKVAISSGVAQGLLLKSVPPHYPAEALSAHASGTVVVQVRIGKDGYVYDPKVISGPRQLQQAALDAVKDWVYRPYMLNGEAVEVDTTLNIVFNLGR